MLRPEEVEILVCGSPKLDLRELQKNTEYDGYKAADRVIKYNFSTFLYTYMYNIMLDTRLVQTR